MASILFLALALCGQADEPSYVEVRGGTYRLPTSAECKAVVLVFVGHDCPISNAYAPEIGRLHREFAPKKIAFCVVYADADLSVAEARKHAEAFGYSCPAIVDPKMTLVRRIGATI